MNNRTYKNYKYERVSSEIKRIADEVISNELQDPRVLGNANVTDVELSHDMSHCRIFVNIFCNDKKSVMDGLKNASGFIRHIIADALDMRKTPELSFVVDDSIEKRNRIEELLKQIK